MHVHWQLVWLICFSTIIAVIIDIYISKCMNTIGVVKTRYPENDNPFIYCSTLLYTKHITLSRVAEKTLCALISRACVYLIHIAFNSTEKLITYPYLPIYMIWSMYEKREAFWWYKITGICINWSWLCDAYSFLRPCFCKRKWFSMAYSSNLHFIVLSACILIVWFRHLMLGEIQC